jgi:hypothetical protein
MLSISSVLYSLPLSNTLSHRHAGPPLTLTFTRSHLRTLTPSHTRARPHSCSRGLRALTHSPLRTLTYSPLRTLTHSHLRTLMQPWPSHSCTRTLMRPWPSPAHGAAHTLRLHLHPPRNHPSFASSSAVCTLHRRAHSTSPIRYLHVLSTPLHDMDQVLLSRL